MPEMKFKEKFQDPNTGELVTRVEIPPNLLVEIDKHVVNNSAGASAFLQLARMTVINIKQLIAQFDKASEAEQAIGKEVIRIREKMGLDSAWVYNIPLKMMEKREPPPDTKTIPAGIVSDKK